MPIERIKFITRAMLRSRPEVLFVFGDNLLRQGYGGQAREMRDEPNAVGIPTKRAPASDPGDFFSDSDADFEAYLEASCREFIKLTLHLARGGTVVLPEDGLGTGLADLANKAPRIWERLQQDLRYIEMIA